MTTPAVRLSEVFKAYGEVPAACSVDVALAPAEIVTVIGPSGCGKSTLLRLIAGLERPDSGCIEVAGETMADERRFVPPEKRRVGLVFQDNALFPHLDVARNVGFGLAGWSPRPGETAGAAATSAQPSRAASSTWRTSRPGARCA